MTPAVGRALRTTPWLFLVLLAPRFAEAQASPLLQKEITVSAIGTFRGPYVSSFARAVLYDASGARLYNTQVIIGHAVGDLDTSSVLFQARIVSDIGYANSRASSLEGTWDHCYIASMAVHVNTYNYHGTFYSDVDCIESPPDPIPEPPEENCPVLLDLRQDGFHLSGPDPAVSFDIDADGIQDRIAWTKAGEDDAFLCLDRNHNRVIDDGTELFGYATPLLSGRRARIGYRALAELDLPELGGNNDGILNAGDSRFADLCAWVDGNRDGVSQSDEILTLSQAGVVGLEYRYKTIHITDSFGNLFRYASSALMRSPSGVVHDWPTFDVIFAEL